jgi:hypothetical protein
LDVEVGRRKAAARLMTVAPDAGEEKEGRRWEAAFEVDP